MCLCSREGASEYLREVVETTIGPNGMHFKYEVEAFFATGAPILNCG